MVELADQAYWFWDAPNDIHGSTMNSLALGHPESYKSYINSAEGQDRAQWTRALTMPHAVVQAHANLSDSD